MMCDYMASNRRARRSRTGAQYFDKFCTHFWERSEDEFDRICNINSSNCWRNRDVENTTPAPSIEKVEHTNNRSLSITSRRSLRHSPYPTSTHDNTNINNPGMRNSEQNISVPPPPIKTLSPQPPSYSRGENAIASGVTNETQNNNQSQDSSNYEIALSSSNLTPDLLNLSLSRNESDAIMHDIGSQPLFYMESINE
ncbi:12053_t:CDS:2 [Gigaspora rosea]|nr:12053_t:CDS:2 [Gigaspora rosea]